MQSKVSRPPYSGATGM